MKPGSAPADGIAGWMGTLKKMERRLQKHEYEVLRLEAALESERRASRSRQRRCTMRAIASAQRATLAPALAVGARPKRARRRGDFGRPLDLLGPRVVPGETTLRELTARVAAGVT